MNAIPPDDEGLAREVALAAAGDRDAFAALVRRHQRPLFAFLGRMGLHRFEAEEIAQDTFLRCWQHLPRYRAEQAAFSTWLYTIARRLALNALDRAERRWRDDRDGAGLLEPASGEPGPAQALQSQQASAALQRALRRLAVHDRSVLALAYVQDLALEEVARIEGCSASAAKARLHRARQHLRQALQDLNPMPLERTHDGD